MPERIRSARARLRFALFFAWLVAPHGAFASEAEMRFTVVVSTQESAAAAQAEVEKLRRLLPEDGSIRAEEHDAFWSVRVGYFAGAGGDSSGILDKLKNLALRDKIKAQLDANPEFAKFVEGGAFPLKIAQIENGQSKTIMEVTGVERKSLDDSLFAVPGDYKKMEIPGMPGMPGAKR